MKKEKEIRIASYLPLKICCLVILQRKTISQSDFQQLERSNNSPGVLFGRSSYAFKIKCFNRKSAHGGNYSSQYIRFKVWNSFLGFLRVLRNQFAAGLVRLAWVIMSPHIVEWNRRMIHIYASFILKRNSRS